MNRRLFFLIPFFLIVTVVVYFFWSQQDPFHKSKADAYAFVPESVSKSAAIRIGVPKGSTVDEVKAKLSFEPKVLGEFVMAPEDTKNVYFQPQDELPVGQHFLASLPLTEGVMKGEFKVAEDPEVMSILPGNESEAYEKTDITIMFNRPMVPLTTLEVKEDMEVPVEITPKTEGRFRWIGTSTLQFQPEDHLIASAHYIVMVNKDFVSLDGLPIKEFKHEFTTRALRYSSASYSIDGPIETQYINASQALSIPFNQPIDLQETASQVVVKDQNGNPKEFIYEYGKVKKYDEEQKKEIEEEDRSLLWIFAKQDLHGRPKMWDFKDSYEVALPGGVSEQGDIMLEQSIQIPFTVIDVITGVTALSKRSSLVSQEVFDPEGKIIISFYEPVDIDTVVFDAPNVSQIEYGMKCKMDENSEEFIPESVECEKEIDTQTLEIAFDAKKFVRGQAFDLVVKKVVNTSGMQLNAEDVVFPFIVTPEFKFLSSVPAEGEKKTSVTDLRLCTNVPLSDMDSASPDEQKNFMKANDVFELIRVLPSEWIGNEKDSCFKNFQTNIQYRLKPFVPYELNFHLQDAFGAEMDWKIHITTGDIVGVPPLVNHFQDAYAVMHSDKTVLTYGVENLPYMDVNICKVDPKRMAEVLMQKLDMFSGSVTGCVSIKKDRITMDKNYWVKSYFQVDIAKYFPEKFGHYIITLSHPNLVTDFWDVQLQKKEYFERTYATVTDLNVVQKKFDMNNGYFSEENKLTSDQKKGLQNFLWVTQASTLSSVAGAKIQSYQEKTDDDVYRIDTVEGGLTNVNGIIRFPLVDNLIGTVITRGNDSALIPQYDSTSGSNFGGGPGALTNNQKAYLYSDRPIYKPGDTVSFKGMVRMGYDRNYVIPEGKKMNFQLMDPQYQSIKDIEVEVSPFGTFSFDYILDASVSLGDYSVSGDGYYAFSVQEYIPSAFKVDITSPQEEYTFGEKLNVDIDARYYFGVPLEGGDVEYTITSQNYYFDIYQDEWFGFGNSFYRCDWECSFGDKFLGRGKKKLSDDGKVSLDFDLNMKKWYPKEEEQSSKLFTVNASVINKNGQTVSSQKTFIVHMGDMYLGLLADGFSGVNENIKAKVKSLDTQGKPVAKNNLKLIINSLEWIENQRQELDGGFYYRGDWKRTLVKSIDLSTDKDGNWNGDFKLDTEGEYELRIEGKDAKGNMVFSTQNIYVTGQNFVNVRNTNDTSLDMVAAKKNLEIGEKGSFVVKSPFENAKALVSFERGNIYDYEIIDVTGSLFPYEFDMKELYAPNVYVSVSLISHESQMKFGQLEFRTDYKYWDLDIDVKPGKTSYLPGEEVKLDIDVRDHSGKPVETELSLAVVDMSVLALKGNPKKDPVSFYYSGLPLAVTTSSNLKNFVKEVDLDSLRRGKGGGGSEPGDLAKKKRGEFKDTAYWNATVLTDTNGKASLSFVLPGNLTTWQIESLGVTKDTLVGVDYLEFMSQKDLMIIPLIPRFLVPGDEISLGARVYNQTDKKMKIDVKMESDSLDFSKGYEDSLKLDPKSSAIVYFPAKAPKYQSNGNHDILFSAHAEGFADEVEVAIPVTPNIAMEVQATSGIVSESSTDEYVYLPENIVEGKGELQINANATLASFSKDALQYLLSYPYGCVEQVSSSLESLAVAKKLLGVENIEKLLGKRTILGDDGKEYTLDELVDKGVENIIKAQNDDGSFSYYAGTDSHFHVGLHVAQVYATLQDAGYTVPKDSLEKLMKSLRDRVNYDVELQKNEAIMLATAFTFSKFDDGYQIPEPALKVLKGINKKYIADQAGTFELLMLKSMGQKSSGIFDAKVLTMIDDALSNMVTIDARGAYLPTRNQVQYELYESSIKNTAMYVSLLSEKNVDDLVIDKILRWLIASRDHVGAWGSTNATKEVFNAFAVYQEVTGESAGDLEAHVSLDNQEIGSYIWKKDGIFDVLHIFKPLSDLATGVLHALNLKKSPDDKKLFYDMSLKYYLPIEDVAPREEGFRIERNFYTATDTEFITPVKEAEAGEVLQGRIKIFVPKERNNVAIEDYIPAGMELVNSELSTENIDVYEDEESFKDDALLWQENHTLYPSYEEYRDDRLFLFMEHLSPGEYEYTYYIRALIPGNYQHMPAYISEMYTPENFGRTQGEWVGIEEKSDQASE